MPASPVHSFLANGGFLERAGTLPRGTGFIARFLIAWPGSTQGTRAYRPAPEAMPQVMLFQPRICQLLAQPLATDVQGCLTPAVLELSLQAHAGRIRFHDEVEGELGARGAFRSVRDVAAKAAENVARLAALFHVLEHGASGTIASGEIRAAACIVGWHLNEARRPRLRRRSGSIPIRRCSSTGNDIRRCGFDTGGCCYSRYRRPGQTLIGSKSSRGCRVGNWIFHVPGGSRMTGATSSDSACLVIPLIATI
jgi:hypothetical protein